MYIIGLSILRKKMSPQRFQPTMISKGQIAKIPYWVDPWMNQIFPPHNLKSLLAPPLGGNNRNNMNNMNDGPGGYSNSNINNIGYSNI